MRGQALQRSSEESRAALTEGHEKKPADEAEAGDSAAVGLLFCKDVTEMCHLMHNSERTAPASS